jgi:hypothetical protein
MILSGICFEYTVENWNFSAGFAGRWKLVLFIRHLPQLTPAEQREMEALNLLLQRLFWNLLVGLTIQELFFLLLLLFLGWPFWLSSSFASAPQAGIPVSRMPL